MHIGTRRRNTEHLWLRTHEQQLKRTCVSAHLPTLLRKGWFTVRTRLNEGGLIISGFQFTKEVAFLFYLLYSCFCFLFLFLFQKSWYGKISVFNECFTTVSVTVNKSTRTVRFKFLFKATLSYIIVLNAKCTRVHKTFNGFSSTNIISRVLSFLIFIETRLIKWNIR